MQSRLRQRPDEVWIEALRGVGAEHSEAVQELTVYLRRVLWRTLHGRVDPDDLAELVQESLARIVRGLDAFRGDSAFPTWATGVATRVAFTELRRRSVRANAVESFDAVREEVQRLESETPPPDEAAAHRDLLAALRLAIRTRLTHRQRVAILAELRGVPTVEIAAQLETNQNALYKLTHDARKKLRAALLEAGFGEDALHARASEVTP